MLCGVGKIIYFCSVKSYGRYLAAAASSVFCATILLVKYCRKEWSSSNTSKVSARMNLTAPIAASLFNVKYIRL